MTHLPPLYWRIGATPSRPNNSDKSTAQQQLNTLLTQVQGCHYWQVLADGTAQTPPYIVIGPIGAPTANSSQFSSSSNMQVVITTNISGSTAYRSPDTTDATTPGRSQFRLQIGMTPDITQGGSGSLSTAQRDRPFQTATGNPRWSGYWHCANTGSVSASFILESLDNIYIGFKDNAAASGTFGVLVGNIIETPDSASGENNFRRYGMATGGSNQSFATTFWTTTVAAGSIFGTVNADGAVHVGTFIVSGGIPNGDVTAGVSTKIWEYHYHGATATPTYDDYATWHTGPAGSRQIAMPVVMYSSTLATNAVPFRYTGILRGVFHASDDRGGIQKIQSGGIDQVYKVTATHNQNTNDTFIVGPASGSGL